MKALFDNPKPVVFGILIFLVAFFSIRSCYGSGVELGPTLLSGYGMVYSESIGEQQKWDVGVMLISEQSWDGNVAGNNGGIFIERLVRYKRFSMGLGAAGWIGTSRLIGTQLTYHMSLRFLLPGDRFTLNYRHWSNAGTTPDEGPNRGQDLVTVGWIF